jgi:SAM-dependent methyltransferase
MEGSRTHHGCRSCRNCGAKQDIGETELLWPAGFECAACGSRLAQAGGIVQLAPGLDQTSEGYDLESFEFLEGFEGNHFWFKSRNELIAWLVRRFAPQAKRVMEIGCGTGFVLNAIREALPSAKICGSELHSQGLSVARKRHGEDVELIQMDARASGLSDALDLVGAFDVLEHIEEDLKVLEECAAMLRPGGVLIATVPQHPFMWSAQDDIAHHVRRYKRGELARKAGVAGMATLYQTSFVTLAFPLMAASRLLRGRGGDGAADRGRMEAEFKLPAGANAAMLALQRAEHGLRRAGVPLPFGGSQVLVARKR